MTETEKEYKVVIQLTGNDPAIQKATIGQVNNILKALEKVRIEVVTHSHGIELLFNNSAFKNTLEQLHGKGVTFLVCQNAMDAQNIEKGSLLPFAEIIPSAVAHLIIRQHEGWSYLRMS